jgi:hypothetical protein
MIDASQRAQSVQFTLEVEGILDPRWAEWFDGIPVAVVPSGPDARQTTLIVTLPDQSALPAILAQVTGLNLKVLSVRASRLKVGGTACVRLLISGSLRHRSRLPIAPS